MPISTLHLSLRISGSHFWYELCLETSGITAYAFKTKRNLRTVTRENRFSKRLAGWAQSPYFMYHSQTWTSHNPVPCIQLPDPAGSVCWTDLPSIDPTTDKAGDTGLFFSPTFSHISHKEISLSAVTCMCPADTSLSTFWSSSLHPLPLWMQKTSLGFATLTCSP